MTHFRFYSAIMPWLMIAAGVVIGGAILFSHVILPLAQIVME